MDYELISMSDGLKKEKWGNYILVRPDPLVIWHDDSFNINDADAIYEKKDGGGSWKIINKNIPSSWLININNLTLNVKLMGFKHTGVFPEQETNWKYLDTILKDKNAKVLNLFAYTGAASCAALKAGASVCHVDSSKGMIEVAKENVLSSNLDMTKIRFIQDDCLKFVKREARRGKKYDVILMDPPSFGRGSKGEVWNINKDLYSLIKECLNILSDKPILFLINSYSEGLPKEVIENILKILLINKYGGKVISYNLDLITKNNLKLPCGSTTRWEA